MAAIEGGGNAGGRSGGGVMKKGPWTSAEDEVLTRYVEQHGEGNWNAVQRNSGLMRCGKSCRLRWSNHLRPDLKKGAFTPEEERKIIDLHARLGNKWARMALHLHGRTDNEIKNYWNTRLKKRQRAGLPIYPHNIQQNQNPNLLSSLDQRNHNFYRSHPTFFNSFTFASPNAPFPYHDSSRVKLLRDANGPVALSLSSSSNKPFSTASSISPVPAPYYSQLIPHTNFNMNALGGSFNGFTRSQAEPPSIQSPFEAITQTSSTNTDQSEYVFPTSSEAENYENAPPKLYSRENSGLLGDVLRDSQALMNSKKGKEKEIQAWEQTEDSQALMNSEKVKGKEIQAWEQTEDFYEVDVESIFKAAESNTTSENNLEDSSSGHSSFEIGSSSNPLDDFEEMNFLTETDFSSLLDDFPLSPPISDCYAANDDSSTTKSSDNAGTSTDHQPEFLRSTVMAAPGVAPNQMLNQETGSWWNNMPSFS